MINFNGELLFEENVKLSSENRGFKYGDAVFETIKVSHKRVVFWEDHYFRLMASIRMLRMKIPMQFTLEFLEKEILKTVAVQEEASSFRVRLNVYRKDGGLYTPKTNEIDYLIDVKVNTYQTKNTYTVDVFKDFYELLKDDGVLMITTRVPHMDWILKFLETIRLNQKRTSAHCNLIYLN